MDNEIAYMETMQENPPAEEMHAKLLHSMLEFVAGVSQKTDKAQIDVAFALYNLHENKAHEKLGYESFHSMLAENNVTYSRRTISMLLRAGWVMATAINQNFEKDFSAYSVAKLEMVARPMQVFLSNGQPEEAKHFLGFARHIDHGGISRSDIRKAMIEAGIVQARPKRYLVYVRKPDHTELAFVETTEDPTTAPSYVQAIVEVKKPHRAWEAKTYKSFACKE